MMLLPDRDDFAGSQLPSKNHETLNPGAIHEEHQYHFAKGWAYCFYSGYWYAFAAPGRIIQLYLILMQEEFLFLVMDGKHIVAFGMNQYLIKALFFEYLNKVIRTIPTVKGDGESIKVNVFLMEYFHQLMDHILEYLWFGCVTPTLFAYRSDTQRYNLTLSH